MIKTSLVILALLFYQQPDKRVFLPGLTLQEYNIVMQALESCDCPAKSTPVLYQSFLAAGKAQQPGWFGLKVDSTKKGGKP